LAAAAAAAATSVGDRTTASTTLHGWRGGGCGSPEVPESGADVARRVARPAAAAAAAVAVERVLGGEGQLREVAARQVALDDDEPTGADTAEYAASGHSQHRARAPRRTRCKNYPQMRYSVDLLIRTLYKKYLKMRDRASLFPVDLRIADVYTEPRGSVKIRKARRKNTRGCADIFCSVYIRRRLARRRFLFHFYVLDLRKN